MRRAVVSDNLSEEQPHAEEVEDLTRTLNAGQLLIWPDGDLVFRVVKSQPNTVCVVIIADDGEPAIIDRKDYESARRRMQ